MARAPRPSVRISTRAHLEALGVAGAPIADVSRGAWRGHQVARELCAQLGLAPPERVHPSLRGAAAAPTCADIIGWGIDAESRGDASMLATLVAADRVAEAAEDVVVLAPGHGLVWEPEDLVLVRELARRVRLVLVGVPPSADDALVLGDLEWTAAPAEEEADDVDARLVALTPGIVDPDVAAALGVADGDCLLALANGRFLVPPERRPTVAPTALEYDRLAAAAAGVGWLRAYAQYHGNNLFVEPEFLATEAWERFAEGGSGIALRLLERAGACSVEPSLRAVVDCQAQGVRIGTSRFRDAAAADDPSPAVSAELRRLLLLAKGYGHVMSDDVESGRPYLDEARSLFNTGDEREHLYLLNIAALERFKAGDLAGALDLEHEISARAPSDWRLAYVNAVNLARLYMRLDHLAAAEEWYHRAFATTAGSRSTSEAVYRNVCLARLHLRRSRMPEALACWLRAALHWAATDVPETLGPRVVAALTAGREGPPTVTVSDALRDNLLAAAAAAGVAVPDVSDGAAPTFVRAGGRRPAAAVGAPGWGVLVCNDVPTASRPATQPVRALLVGLLGVPELADAGAVVVDDRLGQEIAQTPEELLESALRLGVERVAWRGHATIELDGDVSEHLQATMRVQLASGVSSVDGAAVTSQRADAPAFVSDDDVRILEALSERPTVGQLAARLSRSPADLLSRLRALEEARIVYLQCSEDTCTRAGISWHSRASSPATSRL